MTRKPRHRKYGIKKHSNLYYVFLDDRKRTKMPYSRAKQIKKTVLKNFRKNF